MDNNNNQDSVKTQSRIQAKKLIGKVIVSKNAKKFGEVSDLIFDTETGEIIDFNLKNETEYVSEISLERDSNGDLLVPFHSVIAIGDFIVINEEDLTTL